MVTRHATLDEQIDYGYQWYIARPSIARHPWYAGFGNGGQRLLARPSGNLAIAIFAGNYNQPDAWKVPVALTIAVMQALRHADETTDAPPGDKTSE